MNSTDHVLSTSKRLRQFECGPSLGFGSRRNGSRVLVAIWGKDRCDRFAGYVERRGELEEHRIIEGIPAAVAFLSQT